MTSTFKCVCCGVAKESIAVPTCSSCWYCSVCDKIYPGTVSNCALCHKSQRKATTVGMIRCTWDCTRCGNVNPSYCVMCIKCGDNFSSQNVAVDTKLSVSHSKPKKITIKRAGICPFFVRKDGSICVISYIRSTGYGNLISLPGGHIDSKFDGSVIENQKFYCGKRYLKTISQNTLVFGEDQRLQNLLVKNRQGTNENYDDDCYTLYICLKNFDEKICTSGKDKECPIKLLNLDSLKDSLDGPVQVDGYTMSATARQIIRKGLNKNCFTIAKSEPVNVFYNKAVGHIMKIE